MESTPLVVPPGKLLPLAYAITGIRENLICLSVDMDENGVLHAITISGWRQSWAVTVSFDE